MSSTEPIDGEYVLYDEEPSPIYQNEGILQNVGEYLVAPLGQENVPTNNDNPATPRPPQVRQQPSLVDENNYSLATPESCKTNYISIQVMVFPSYQLNLITILPINAISYLRILDS